MTDYHNPDSCNKCQGENKLLNYVFYDGFMHEAETECTKCGFKDYWAHGFFESGSEMKSNCKTYNFKHPDGE